MNNNTYINENYTATVSINEPDLVIHGDEDPSQRYTSPLTNDYQQGSGETDAINPKHYEVVGGISVNDFIYGHGLSFGLGNTVKYITRAGKKNKDKYIEDLEKARWYLDAEIELLKSDKESKIK